jgi:putative sterol carrier protein
VTDLAAITDGLKPFLGDNAGYARTLKFDLKGDGFLRIAGATVTNDDGPADCTIIVSLGDLAAISKGDLDPAEAFQQGKLRIDGDMAVAMDLQPLFSRAWS